MGTKVSSIIVREASSGSQCGGTSCRIKSGRTESSGWGKLVSIWRLSPKKDVIQVKKKLAFTCKIEEWREILAVRHSRTFFPKLVKEGVGHRFHRAKARSWCVLQQLRY